MFEQIIEGIKKLLLRISRISGIQNLDLKQIALFALIPFVALLIEMLIVGWKNSSLRNLVQHSRSAQGDAWCFILGAFKIFDLLGIILTFGLVYAAIVLLDKNLHLDLFLAIDNVWVRGSLLFIISDFKNYVRHYCFHKFGWMWELHKFHHSADKFTMLSAQRGHFVEASVSRLFDALPFVLLGSNPQEFVLINALRETHQYFLHSQIRSDWGWIGKYILVSPTAHWMHHSTDARHYNSNIGSTFIFWDRIFRTYYKPEEVKEIGLPDNPFNRKSFFREQYDSYKLSLKRLSGKN